MTINRTPRTFIILVGAFALTAVSASAKVRPTAAQTAPKTLEDVRMLAVDAAEHSEIYGREVVTGQLTSSDQADQIERVRNDVNRMGKDLAILEAERPNLEPWQQETLDQIKPELHIAVANTTDAIDYFNAHGRGQWTVDNERTVSQITEQTEKIATTVKDHQKLESLEVREAKLARSIPTN